MSDAAPSLLPNLRPSCLVMAERVVQIAELIKNHTHPSFLSQAAHISEIAHHAAWTDQKAIQLTRINVNTVTAADLQKYSITCSSCAKSLASSILPAGTEMSSAPYAAIAARLSSDMFAGMISFSLYPVQASSRLKITLVLGLQSLDVLYPVQ